MSTSVSFFIRHVRWMTIFGILILISSFSARAMAGKDQQGRSLQGLQIAGPDGDHDSNWLRGAGLVVMLRDSSRVEIVDFAGSIIEAFELDSGGRRRERRILRPDDLVGMQWSGSRCHPADCIEARFRVEATIPDRSTNTMKDFSANSDTWLYRVQHLEESAADSKSWSNACDLVAGDTDMGIFVDGHWSPDGTWNPSGYTFSCPSGVIAKCVRSWGYKPWKILQSPLHGSPLHGLSPHVSIDLQRLHLACVRAARADYCGDGDPHTRDGILIDMFDTYGLNEREPVQGFVEESTFDEHGAVDLRHARVTGAMDAASRRGAPTCRREASDRSRDAALIHVWSSPRQER